MVQLRISKEHFDKLYKSHGDNLRGLYNKLALAGFDVLSDFIVKIDKNNNMVYEQSEQNKNSIGQTIEIINESVNYKDKVRVG